MKTVPAPQLATPPTEHLADRAQEHLDVEPQRPVLDVVVVEPRPVGDRGVPAQAADLGQPGQPGLHPVPVRRTGRTRRRTGPRSAAAPGEARPASCHRAGCSTAAAARPATCAAGTAPPGRPAGRWPPTRWSPSRLARRPHRPELDDVERTPSRPTRGWRKNTPRPPSSRTARADRTSSGLSTINPISEKTMSKVRFMAHRGPLNVGRRIRMTGIAPIWSVMPGLLWT